MKTSLSLLALAMLGLSACSSTPTPTAAPTTQASEVGEFRRGFLNGYLAPTALPDSLALLPPPPAQDSPQAAADMATYRALSAMQNGPRGTLAAQDAELKFPAALQAFSCSLGVDISEAHTPHLHMLMRRTLTDAGLATYKAKDHYKRERPFVTAKAPTCTPAEEAHLAKDGSYPSGHASVGWAWALVLAELAPERSNALLQRGRAFGQSRGVCGVHWASDIEAGRTVAAAVISQLSANTTYQSQLNAAKAEITQARARGQTPAAAVCEAQSSAQKLSERMAP